jgi:hypothetical protein
MAHKVLKRAALLFLAVIGIASAIVGLLLWHHTRLANPCPSDGILNGEPVTCYYRVEFMGIDGWPWALGVLLLAFAACVLASWLSQKLRRSGKPGAA